MNQSQSAENAKGYYNDALIKSAYYLDAQQMPGIFKGRIAKQLGIEGIVAKEDFHNLCENINPITGTPLTPRKVENRTVGYDINFHCPKSVSVLHVLSKDEHILEAFRQSVQETMHDIEADSKARVRKGGKDEDRETGELIWAEFIHQTARAVNNEVSDMHLHAHCFTFNVTMDEVEQRFKAVQFRDIKRDMPYYEARFHKRLSAKLCFLGYQIRREKNSFSVVGVPESVLSLFSKRTIEINRIAKEQGITDAKELDQLGARTRAAKQKGLTMAQLKEEWRRQIHALGVTDGDDGKQAIRFAKNPTPNPLTAAECVDHALLHHFERASVARERRLLATAYRFAIGAGVSIADVDKAFQERKDIITVMDGGLAMCTTREVLAEEKRMVDFAIAGKNKFAPLYASPPPVELEGDQAVAACHVLTTTDAVSSIKGGAGTGKTTLLKETVRWIEAAGVKVMAAAPTVKARDVLREEGFAEAETVAKLLTDKAAQKRLTNAVLIVDEAGMIGVRDMLALLQLTAKHNARLVLVGDTRQHSAVERGDALRVLCTVAGIRPAEVTKIYRQKEKYRDAVQDLAVGNVKEAFVKLEALDAIKEIPQPELSQVLAEDYLSVVKQKKSALVVSPTHAQSAEVTTAIRRSLRGAGMISQEETFIHCLVSLNYTEAEKNDPVSYESGQVVQFNQNRPNIMRGSRWTVETAADGVLHVADKTGKQIPLPLSESRYFDVFRETEIGLSKDDVIAVTRTVFDEKGKRLNNGQSLKIVSISEGKITARNTNSGAVYILPDAIGHIKHGYCQTSHSSQGSTCDVVFVAQPLTTFAASSMQQAYVSISRGRERVQIYTDDKTALLDHVSESGDRQSALELTGQKQSQFAAEIHIRKKLENAPHAQTEKQKGPNARLYQPSPKPIRQAYLPGNA